LRALLHVGLDFSEWPDSDDGKIPKGEYLEGEIAASRNGKIAAVSLMQTKGRGIRYCYPPFGHREVVVYDLDQRRAVSKAKVDPLPKSSYHFALSPSGKMLAIMTDSIVRIFDVTNSQTKPNTEPASGK
jgi:hypothetical protein